jgi:hypothetical protein
VAATAAAVGLREDDTCDAKAEWHEMPQGTPKGYAEPSWRDAYLR